tara:strand:- start:287 stop:472 length:186 start_codon:yes stop_codon:yes gene_type:complete
MFIIKLNVHTPLYEYKDLRDVLMTMRVNFPFVPGTTLRERLTVQKSLMPEAPFLTVQINKL